MKLRLLLLMTLAQLPMCGTFTYSGNLKGVPVTIVAGGK